MEENINISREMIHSRLVHFVRGIKHTYDHSLKLGNDIPFFSTFCLAVKRAIGSRSFWAEAFYEYEGIYTLYIHEIGPTNPLSCPCARKKKEFCLLSHLAIIYHTGV